MKRTQRRVLANQTRFRKPSGNLLTLVMAAAIAACSKSEGAAPKGPPPVPVEVAPVVQISAPVEISANGVVEPMQTAAVEAQVGGLLREVAFREGDAVL